MEAVNIAVADNLRLIRERRKLSLDAAAKLTGVSKSMLAQIERGTANPTVSIVWKIASGFRVPFTELVARPEKDYETVDTALVPALSGDDGRFRNYPLFPYDENRSFEIYYIELDPGAFMRAEPHPAGTQEFVTVFSGRLEIHVNGEVLRADTGHAVRFKADSTHSYKNSGGEAVRLSMVISYAGR